MKKLFITTATVMLLAGTSAYAEFNVNVDLGTPGVAYAAPAPVYVQSAPVYVAEPHHRAWHDDNWYWQERRDRAYWEHDHPHGRWDHDGWARDHHAYYHR